MITKNEIELDKTKFTEVMVKVLYELKNLNLENGCTENMEMSKYTTFKIGGKADIIVLPTTIDEVVSIISIIKKYNAPYIVIGNGSNLLVSDLGIRGVVIRFSSNFSGIEVLSSRQEILSIKSGTLFPVVAKYALENNLDGFYPLGGIPSSIGGGVVMNAGCYGVEMKDILLDVTVLTKDLQINVIDGEELELGYRTSNIESKEYIVLGCTIELKKGKYGIIRQKGLDISKKRRESQPLNLPSCGSTFKRPEGNFAGKLIEDCGLKGKNVGGAMVSEKHAGFLVNTGGATCEDMKALIDICKKDVLQKFSVNLELEVKLIGE